MKIKYRLTKSDVEAYLEGLAEYGTLRSACKYAKISPYAIRLWRKTDMTFEGKEQVATEQFHDKLFEEATRRAVEGERVPASYRGAAVYKTHPVTHEIIYDSTGEPIREYAVQKSDKLLIHVLKSVREKLPMTKAEQERLPPTLNVRFVDSDGNGRLPNASTK